jgi:hypothetical protein
MPAVTITEETIQSWIQRGLQQAIESMMRDQYGTGNQLKKAMDKAVSESEAQILAALKVGIAQACVSPSLMKSIEKEIANSLASQYRGAFDGVVRAAAKNAASTEVVAQRVVELTRIAAGLLPSKATSLEDAASDVAR